MKEIMNSEALIAAKILKDYCMGFPRKKDIACNGCIFLPVVNCPFIEDIPEKWNLPVIPGNNVDEILKKIKETAREVERLLNIKRAIKEVAPAVGPNCKVIVPPDLFKEMLEAGIINEQGEVC